MKRTLTAVLGLGILTAGLPAHSQTGAPQQPPQIRPPAAPGIPNPRMVASQPDPGPGTDFSKIFKSDREKFSYFVGVNAAKSVRANLKRANLDVDDEVVAKAFLDSFKGNPTLINDAQEREILTQLQKVIGEKQKELNRIAGEKRKVEGDANKKEGDDFLAKNKTEPGVVTLPSGLQYKILVPGTGPKPTTNDTVTVNYRGTFINGVEFDSSYKSNKPLETGLRHGVIDGWLEVLQLMPIGSKWKVFIPSNLAYKEAGRPPLIGPNVTLVFEMEVISAKPAATPPPMQNSAPLTSDIIRVPSSEEFKRGVPIKTMTPEEIEKEKEREKTNSVAPPKPPAVPKE